MRAVQVKTTTDTGGYLQFDPNSLPNLYHVLALVQLVGEDRTLYLDKCRVFLLSSKDVKKGRYSFEELAMFELGSEVAVSERSSALFPVFLGRPLATANS